MSLLIEILNFSQLFVIQFITEDISLVKLTFTYFMFFECILNGSFPNFIYNCLLLAYTSVCCPMLLIKCVFVLVDFW